MEIYNVGFLGSTVSSAGWDFDDDFTTNKGWSFADPSSTNQVDTTAEKLYVDTTTSNTGGTNRASSIDMGLGTVSATNWVFEVLKYRITAQAKYANNHMAITASTSAVPSYSAGVGWNPSHTIYSSIYHAATYQRQNLGWTTGGSVGDGDTIDNIAPIVFYGHRLLLAYNTIKFYFCLSKGFC